MDVKYYVMSHLLMTANTCNTTPLPFMSSNHSVPLSIETLLQKQREEKEAAAKVICLTLSFISPPSDFP